MNPIKNVGILGDGQLSQMLTLAAFKLGLAPWVLTASDRSPAEKAGALLVEGRLDDLLAVQKFFEKVSLAVFENEFIDCHILDLALKAVDPPTVLQPSTAVMESFRDKLKQKHCLVELGIPTAPFIPFESNKETLTDWLTRVSVAYENGCVLKWGRFGYDGKGVHFFDPSLVAAAQNFSQVAIDRKVSLYAEEKIKFKRELAMVCVQSVNDEFVHYPLVISEQRQGVCRKVYGPAREFGVSANSEKVAVEAGRRLAKRAGLVGAFAVEFFETDLGHLSVNEISPRVHNSGHYTQDAAVTSQFENHWRAVLAMPLGETKTSTAFAMLNILGPDRDIVAQRVPLPEVLAPAKLHWYGKDKISPLRKLGHINVAVSNVSGLTPALTELEQNLQKWEKIVEALRDE